MIILGHIQLLTIFEGSTKHAERTFMKTMVQQQCIRF